MNIAFYYCGNIMLYVKDAATHPRPGDSVSIHTSSCKAEFLVVNMEWDYQQSGDRTVVALNVFLRSA